MIDTIGCNTRLVAVTSGFRSSPGPPLLGDTYGTVSAHSHGHRNGQQTARIFPSSLFACNPGGRWGDTVRILAQWQRPVASSEALDPLHWSM